MREITTGKDHIKQIKSMGFLFRSLVLHSGGYWTARGVIGGNKKHTNFIETNGETPEEAIEKLFETLEEKGLLKEPE
jgi:hypothetical protein